MADDMTALYQESISGNTTQGSRKSDPTEFSMNAHAFFVMFGKSQCKCSHKFFTKKDGMTPLDGLHWARPFYKKVSNVFIGKNLAGEGMTLQTMATELQNPETTYEIHIHEGSEEAYISKPRVAMGESSDDLFA